MRQNNLFLFVGFFLSFFTLSEAAIYVDFNSHALIKCELSSTHHNRITLSEGRIKKVIFPEANVSIRLEDESGQVFVQTLFEIVEPITLSIITEGGEIQDFELEFFPKSSEIVILNMKSAYVNDCDAENVVCEEKLSFDSMIENLQAILKGQTPKGYFSIEGNGNQYVLKKYFLLSEKIKYVSAMHTITVWEVKNTSCWCQNISESDLNFEGITWVYLGKNQLKKLEKTFAITSVRNYE